jgi:hypothetical protein
VFVSDALARLPWEFLFDPVRQDYLGLTVPLIRYPHVPDPQQPLWVAAPLRILGMVGCPGGLHALDAGRSSSGCKVRWRVCSATGW